ncbi:MAG TPA: GGDEF domain-containing protein [Ruminiclostridium sp.]
MNNKRWFEILLQDIGLLLFLISVFCCAVVIYIGGAELLLENSMMFFVVVVAIILITFSIDIAAFIVVASQIICYTAYKLFYLYESGSVINAASYAWLILPIAVVGSMKLFCLGRNHLELENAILKQQVEDLVMVDTLTGLYNLRSFYYDIDRQIRYTRRNKLPLTLMIIQLRYAQELNKVLSKTNYDKLKQRLAEISGDTLRVEDRQYSIDKDGSLAVILTCDEKGGVLVGNRIRSMICEKSAFDKIINSSIKVDVQVAFVQYNEEMGNDVVYFKKCVEKELQYDV